jgi:hypothetical protein
VLLQPPSAAPLAEGPSLRGPSPRAEAPLARGRPVPRQRASMALLPVLAALGVPPLAGSSVWYGPTALIWEHCPMVASMGNASLGAVKIADCQAACAKTGRGCNAINFLPDAVPATGNRCQLRACAKPIAPAWSVPGWRGYATWPLPPAPPPSPTPPSPPSMPLVLLTKQQAAMGAACLDGSPPGFYWEAGRGVDAKKFIVFLNGGGWCYTLAPSTQDPFGIPGGPHATGWGNDDSCWGRSQSALGSTNHNPPTREGGWLAETPMANWSKASVVYCDGTSFSGDREAPVVAAGSGSPAAAQNRTLYFRGRRNLDAVIDELRSRGMGRADVAVLGGCSAGGLGALIHCDHFVSAITAVFLRGPMCVGRGSTVKRGVGRVALTHGGAVDARRRARSRTPARCAVWVTRASSSTRNR